MHKVDFGEDFLWGVSTAAYQIEGAYQKDGKGLSIWDDFVRDPKRIKDLSDANIACDHYNKVNQDIDLIKELNIPNYRFSTSWSRILPSGVGRINSKGVDFYDRLIDGLLEKGIVPWLTLYHWDLPLVLQKRGGWTNRDVVYWFEEYLEVISSKYGDRVKNWMVLNEPMVFTGAGHFLGIHAPGIKKVDAFLSSVYNASLVQGVGVRRLKELHADHKVGTTFSCSYITPYKDKSRHQLAVNRVDAVLNRLFIEPLLGYGFPVNDFPFLKRLDKFYLSGDEEKMKAIPDFVGIQNYTREVVKPAWYIPYIQSKLVEAKKRGKETTLMGWEIYPESIYEMIKKYASYPEVKSVIVTENGAAFEDHIRNSQIHDFKRTRYIQSYLSQILRAKKEGLPVDGYFIWTLMDNFEWAEGYKPTFGIVHNNFKTQKRTIKDSGKWYQDFLS